MLSSFWKKLSGHERLQPLASSQKFPRLDVCIQGRIIKLLLTFSSDRYTMCTGEGRALSRLKKHIQKHFSIAQIISTAHLSITIFFLEGDLGNDVI